MFNKKEDEVKPEKPVSTRKKNEVDIVKDGDTQFYKCKFRVGGELPDMLKGQWTSMVVAEEARNMYYDMKGK